MKNSLPQGSILALAFQHFYKLSIFMSNDNNIKNLIYVYYVVIAMQGSTFETLKEKFTNILENTSNYFKLLS